MDHHTTKTTPMPTKTHRTHTKCYARRAHSVSALHAHLVFVVTYRRRVITEPVFNTLRRSMRTSAHQLGCRLTAIESDGDHLHVLITYPTGLSIAKMVQRLKGASSRMVRAERWPECSARCEGATSGRLPTASSRVGAHRSTSSKLTSRPNAHARNTPRNPPPDLHTILIHNATAPIGTMGSVPAHNHPLYPRTEDTGLWWWIR